MYSEIPLWLSLAFIAVGLVALAWSSDTFVDGAATIAKVLGISPFIIGMVIIGFGTSAPELAVSVMSGASGHANLSLGNAYGSCVFNIAVILGIAVMIFPLVVKPAITYVAGPGEALVALFSFWMLCDGSCTRGEACALLGLFAVLLPLYCWFDQKTSGSKDRPSEEPAQDGRRPSIVTALVKVAAGLGILVGSSHILVWGSVDLAKAMGVSDLVIGLTIVAAGTSLPELASGIASARRGEHEFVLGNIVGSNLFNMLAVVGLATVISPLVPADGRPAFSPYVITRDLPLLIGLSLSISLFGINWRHPKWPGAIVRREAVLWLLVFVVYTVVMFCQERNKAANGRSAPEEGGSSAVLFRPDVDNSFSFARAGLLTTAA